MSTQLFVEHKRHNAKKKTKKKKKKTLDLFPIKYKTYYNFAFEQKGMVILDDSIRR